MPKKEYVKNMMEQTRVWLIERDGKIQDYVTSGHTITSHLSQPPTGDTCYDPNK